MAKIGFFLTNLIVVIAFIRIFINAVEAKTIDMAVDRMDTILEYLNIDRRTVIEHELINIDLPHNIHKRSVKSNRFQEGNMRIRAFGEDINMWLHPRDSLLASAQTPVYFARGNWAKSGGVNYVLQNGLMENVGQLFENVEHHASLVIGSDEETNQPIVTGNIRSRRDNSAIVIRPLPLEIVNEHLRKRRSNNDERNLNLARHVALKIKDYLRDNNIYDAHEKVNIRRNSTRLTRSTNESSMVDYSGSIYPKIFVQLEYSHSRHIAFSYPKRRKPQLLRLLEYVLAFWNGVDLSFRQLENPGVRLHIAGIAIATAEQSTPYILNNIDGDNFNHVNALWNASSFFYAINDQISYRSYDIAVVMAGMFFYAERGLSFIGDACLIDRFQSYKYGVALISDNSSFSGIGTAVHEISHTLGALHDDGKEDPQCDNSYIMGAASYPSPNKAKFSRCSLAKFNEQLRKGALWCMYDPPQKKPNLPKLMPGKMKNVDKQCEDEGYPGACPTPTENICVQLMCASNYADDECVELDVGAAPGTPCGRETDAKPRFCLQNQCVSLD